MTTTQRKVLVGVDFSDHSQQAIDAAIDQCAGSGELHALCALDHGGHVNHPRRSGPKDPALEPEEVHSSLEQLVTARLLEKAGKDTQIRAFVHVRVGAPTRALAAAAEDFGVDLLVVGTHGRHGVTRLWAGSVAERLVRVAPCPVLVVRGMRGSQPVVEPEPEPVCAACKDRRTATQGAEWWCEQHAAHEHRATHGYSSHLNFRGRSTPLW